MTIEDIEILKKEHQTEILEHLVKSIEMLTGSEILLSVNEVLELVNQWILNNKETLEKLKGNMK